MTAAPSSPPVAMELGLFMPGAGQPYQRLPLHPKDVACMRQAAQLENLNLGDFMVLAAFQRAKEALDLADQRAQLLNQLGLCQRAHTCLRATQPSGS